MRVDAALARAAQLFEGQLGYRPEIAARIELKRRALMEALSEVETHCGAPTYRVRVGQHLHMLRDTAVEVGVLVQEARGRAC